MDQLAKAYLRIRTKKHEVVQQLETEISKFDEMLDSISAAMKDHLRAVGGTSLKTPHGTIIMQNKRRYYARDWELFSDWVLKNNGLDLLEKRVAQGNMGQWLEQHPNNPPPGLEISAEQIVTVRKV